MKKLLLIAAMAVVALGASAGYTIEKVWELNTSSLVDKSFIRQGFGMNGKFYINDRDAQTVYEVGENGLTGVTFPGGGNCGITRDQAGNIVVSGAAFAAQWAEATIIVINPTTGETKEYVVPDECGLLGRCDFLGFAKGNMMEDGALFLTGKTPGTEIYTGGIAIFTVTNGEVDMDNCFLANTDDLLAGQTATNRDNMTVMNFYDDIDGIPTVLYVFRSYSGNDVVKLTYNDGVGFESATNIDLPGKGACNGTCPFIWDGKEFFVYPQTPNYYNGFAISEGNAEEPIIIVPATVSANMNAFQSNWVNAEVDANGVTIYQYAPGANIAVYRLTKETEVPNVYMLGGDDQEWDPTSGTLFDYDAENNVYTATITFPAEYNFFGFTTELAENNDEGGWNYIEPFRFGAIADEGTDFWYEGQDYVSLTWDEYHAIRIPGGEYKLTIDLDDMKLYIEKVNNSLRGDVDMDGNVGISDVSALIDYLLSNDPEGVDVVAADCDMDGNVGISDVSALIDYLLSQSWD